MSAVGKPFSRRYHHTEHTDALIRRAYESTNYQRRSIRGVSEALSMPVWIVYRRALELGCIVPTRKEPPWSKAEEELLESLSHLNPHDIAKRFRAAGYSRTPTAIAVRRKRMMIYAGQARQDEGVYTSRQLAVALGIDAHAIGTWIAKGWLKATRAGTQRTDAQNGDHWSIQAKDIRQFIIDYTAHVNFSKLDKYWLVDLLAPGGSKKAGIS